MQVGRLAQSFEGEVEYLILINHLTFYATSSWVGEMVRNFDWNRIASGFIWVVRI